MERVWGQGGVRIAAVYTNHSATEYLIKSKEEANNQPLEALAFSCRISGPSLYISNIKVTLFPVPRP